MKRWILLAVLVVVLSAIATVAVQVLPSATSPRAEVPFPVADARSGPAPELRVEGDTTYKFGTLSQRTKRTHKWLVHNDGKGDLKLTMIRSTCSCTIANLAQGKTATVKPGDSTEVELEFETRENNGHYRKSATIGSNDPAHLETEFIVDGEVRPAVILVPGAQTDFHELSDDEPDHIANVGVYSADKDDFEIKAVTSSRPGIVTCEIEPMKEDALKHFKVKKGYQLNINVKSGLPLGSFREELVMITNHPLEPETRLYVTGRMTGPISVIPGLLRFVNVHSRTGERGDVTLLVRGHRATKFTVDQMPPKIKAEVVPFADVATTGKYRLTVIVPPGVPPGEISGEIVLKTDHPNAAEVKVPVSIYIQAN